MEWIYSIPEPLGTIIASIIAVAIFLLMFGSPIFIFILGTYAILNSESNKDKD